MTPPKDSTTTPIPTTSVTHKYTHRVFHDNEANSWGYCIDVTYGKVKYCTYTFLGFKSEKDAKEACVVKFDEYVCGKMSHTVEGSDALLKQRLRFPL